MRFAGMDIAADKHVVAVIDEQKAVVVKPTTFTEDATGYAKLVELLGPPGEVLVAMGARGHYWRNLFAVLAAGGHAFELLNPIRTRRFAGEDLQRTKTDAIDALGIARFAAEKRPGATHLPDSVTLELRELIRLRNRLAQDMGDRVRQIHRAVDLGFPEFTRYVRGLDSELATAILREYPTAEAFLGLPWKKLSKLCFDGRHKVGEEIAKASVGRHYRPAYRVQVRFACEDIDLLRRRLRELDADIERTLGDHEVGTLLTTIDGIGPTTAARLVAEFGDLSAFAKPAAMAAYLGCRPGLRQSGKRLAIRAGLTPHGNARLRAKLGMPALTAVRKYAWLRAYYEGLRARGRLPKVALVAAIRKLLVAVH